MLNYPQGCPSNRMNNRLLWLAVAEVAMRNAKLVGKQIIRGWGLFALIAMSGCLAGRFGTASAQDGYGDVDQVGSFDDTLNPYGDWVTVGQVGRVWRPYRAIVGIDFRPYATGGHWVYTDYGWAFESAYDWGWAAFHYGRWFMDPYYGWVWAPGRVWAPAWVDWRFGGGYVGWAPLAPVGFVSYGYYRPSWCFVPTTHFVVRDVYRYALPNERFHAAFAVTSPIQQPVHYAGAQWNAGPPPGQVAHAAGQTINPVNIHPPSPGTVQAVHTGAPSGSAYSGNGAPQPIGRPAQAAPGFGQHQADVQSQNHSSPSGPKPGQAHWGSNGAPPAGATPDAAFGRSDPHWGRSPAAATQQQGNAPQPQYRSAPPPPSAPGGYSQNKQGAHMGYAPGPQMQGSQQPQMHAPPAPAPSGSGPGHSGSAPAGPASGHAGPPPGHGQHH